MGPATKGTKAKWPGARTDPYRYTMSQWQWPLDSRATAANERILDLL